METHSPRLKGSRVNYLSTPRLPLFPCTKRPCHTHFLASNLALASQRSHSPCPMVSAAISSMVSAAISSMALFINLFNFQHFPKGAFKDSEVELVPCFSNQVEKRITYATPCAHFFALFLHGETCQLYRTHTGSTKRCL